VKQLDASVAIIMLSGHGSSATDAWIRSGLIFDFAMKPIDIRELADKIDRARREHDARTAWRNAKWKE
jgi:FixJ family two-component response regulator